MIPQLKNDISRQPHLGFDHKGWTPLGALFFWSKLVFNGNIPFDMLCQGMALKFILKRIKYF